MVKDKTVSNGIVRDIVSSPLNWILVTICCFLLYLTFRPKQKSRKLLEDLLKQDFTLDELAYYDGRCKDGRILIAVNGFVFDVTNNGQDRYGQSGPYASYAGRNASRALARFSATEELSLDYDDLSDLTTDEMNNLKEWERQFREKYHLVGRLLGPNETHQVYEPDDEVMQTKLNSFSKKHL